MASYEFFPDALHSQPALLTGYDSGRGSALVVDDDPANCLLLSQMLEEEGFRTLQALDGAQALTLFERERPDLVFMDVMMPCQDGIETTAQLKRIAGSDFIPIIFLTALNDEESMLRCAQAGGDDFLSKPISAGVLKSRILAMERVRDLHRAIARKNRSLSEHFEREHEEQVLAERLFNYAVTNRNVAIEQLALFQRPADVFNGDLVLSQRLPDGGLRVLVGDFTGHGLPAAIGALPVADVFHSMTRKGVDDLGVLAEINRKLHALLPVDRFMAACMITVPGSGESLQWWNGGMPSMWLRHAGGLTELKSHSLPLGILSKLPTSECTSYLQVADGDRLLVMSDGCLEAPDREDRLFETRHLATLLQGWRYGQPILPSVIAALAEHSADTEPSDDIAILEMPLDATICAREEAPLQDAPKGGWRWSVVLQDERLATLASISELLRPLGVLTGLETHTGALETIVTELYSNALEHGIMQLSSEVKNTPEGFDAYYRERALRLANGCVGQVSLALSYEPHGSGGLVRIEVSDSGAGFRVPEPPEEPDESTCPWGRGLMLVRTLCESVRFSNKGARVEAVYRW